MKNFYAVSIGLLSLSLVGALCSCVSGDNANDKNSASAWVEKIATAAKSDSDFVAPKGAKLVCCEQSVPRILIIDASARDWNSAIIWDWRPELASDIVDKKSFFNVSDAKPVNGGESILVAASGGGFAHIRVADKKVLFSGRVGGNLHSAALLPDGNVATASSEGNKITLFRVVGSKCEFVEKYPLTFAHGVVWDASRKTLWAVGHDELVGYKYFGGKNPRLEQVSSVALEGSGKNGHDLYPIDGADLLLLTSGRISVFDPNSNTLIPAAEVRKIKSISVLGNAVAVLRADEVWWSDTVRVLDKNMSALGRLDGAKFYKVRWLLKNSFSEGKSM